MNKPIDEIVYVVVHTSGDALRSAFYYKDGKATFADNSTLPIEYRLGQRVDATQQIAFKSLRAADYFACGYLEVYEARAIGVERINRNEPALICNSIKLIRHIKTKRFSEYWAECNF